MKTVPTEQDRVGAEEEILDEHILFPDSIGILAPTE